ncbi:MAG: M48 family metalloprotease [Gemmatimonadota bacterium]
MNNVKTFVLLAGLLSLCLVVGQLLGGAGGLLIGGSLGVIMTFGSYWFSDRMVLRGYHAQLVTAEQAPELFAMVDRLRQRAGLPMPRLAIVPQPQPNAFATGRSPTHAIVAVTQGALDLLPPDELEGVLAHELGHIKNHDMLIGTVAAGIAAMLSVVPYLVMFGRGGDDDDGGGVGGLILLMLSPLLAMILQFAISRQREFEADRTGAEIAGKARPLAQALTRLDAIAHQQPMDVSPSLAPLAQVNPLSGARGMMRWLSTHPPTEDRVRALLAMDAGR